MTFAKAIVEELLGPQNPHEPRRFTLEYRPYQRDDESWRWFWVLHPASGDRAAAHGEAPTRHEAAIKARSKARALGGKVVKTSVKV